MKIALITTTINIPELFDTYAENAQAHGHDVFFVAIGDKKTPPDMVSYCAGLEKKYAIPFHALDVPAQEKYLVHFPELATHLEYNSVQRRNIGTLIAYQQGADVVITLDDDNYFIEGDFVGDHLVGLEKEMDVLISKTGWLNVCAYLEEEHGRTFYHRGFPLTKRFLAEEHRTERRRIHTVANAGLWLGDPDIDALAHFYYAALPLRATRFTRTEGFALESGTYCPFNTQNTAIAREALPAYFLSPHAKRYDDIWVSLIVERIAAHLGHHVSFGTPLVRQERDAHGVRTLKSHWRDWDNEEKGLRLHEDFIAALTALPLSGTSYGACYNEVREGLASHFADIPLSDDLRKLIDGYLDGMSVWIRTFARANEA